MRKRQNLSVSNSGYSVVDLVEKVGNSAAALGGVFTYSDFFNMLPLETERKIQRFTARLINKGIITKVKRGVYAVKNPDLWVLASRISPKGYISGDNILAKNGLTGTIPAKRVIIVSPLPRRVYESPFGSVYSLQIKKELMFGFTSREKGVRVADNEKAFLDLVYFYQRGMRFVASPYEGIDLWKLDKKKLAKYLTAYRDKKFTNFVERILSGTD